MEQRPPTRREFLAYLTVTLTATGTGRAVAATSYPDRPVKIIVAYAPGGANDATARIYAQALSERLKQPFVVENRPGASGITGTTSVARSKADGYTLMMGAGGAMTINPGLYPTLSYDPIKDFVPIGLASRTPLVMVVPAALPVKTVAQFIEYAKRPQGVNFASPGAGTPLHLAGELFMRHADVKATHVPYKGSGPAITDLIAGNVDVLFDGANSTLPFIRSGKLKALAVTTAQRSPDLPDVPTLQELGFKDFDVSSWFGFFAPAQTPAEVVHLLESELHKISAMPATQQKFSAIGLEVVNSSSDQLQQMMQRETVRWRDVIRQAGIKAE